MRLPILLLLAAGAMAPAALAEEAKKPEPPLFRRVVPNPTGENGYEELVLAADALNESRLFLEAETGASTLALKRRVLADPPVRRALSLLHRGLSKRVFSPHASVDFITPLPELSSFRRLARLLRIQQYVLLADGRAAEAIATARTTMRLGQAIQTDALIHGLVGIAISSIGIRTLGGHLEQLSVRDCALLQQLCREWLAQPNPFPRVLAGERRAILASLEKAGKEGAGVLLDVVGSEDAMQRQLAAELKRAGSDPAALRALLSQAALEVDRFFERAHSEWRKPAWERSALEPETGAGLGGRFANLLLPSVSRVMDAYTREEAYVRLLACHGAILRFRWEFGKPPPDLAVLNLGELVRDPFTGQHLRYEVVGRRYHVTSAGPVSDSRDAVEGRLPVSVTPQ